MKIHLWSYFISTNLESEKRLDITAQVSGTAHVHYYHVAPQLAIKVDVDTPPALTFVRNDRAINELPEGSTLTVKINGKVITQSGELIDTYPLAVKDHLEFIVVTGTFTKKLTMIVTAITRDTKR
jgi:hypothetical protein